MREAEGDGVVRVTAESKGFDVYIGHQSDGRAMVKRLERKELLLDVHTCSISSVCLRTPQLVSGDQGGFVIIWDVYRGVPLHVVDTQPQTQLPRGIARPDPIALRKNPGKLIGVIGVEANQLAKEADEDGDASSDENNEGPSGALVARTPAMKQALAILHGGYSIAKRKEAQAAKNQGGNGVPIGEMDETAGASEMSTDVLQAIRGYDETAMLKEAAMDQRMNTLRAERAMMASALTFYPAALIAADEAGQAEEALMEEYAHMAGPSAVAVARLQAK